MKEVRSTDKIKDERRDIITNIENIQRIMRAYFKILQSPKAGNLEEIDEFLGAYSLSKSRSNNRYIKWIYNNR